MASPTPKEKAFAAQLQKLTFLVADPTTARTGIRGLLSQLGIKPHQVQVIEMLGDLITMIQKHKPNVIFCDKGLMADKAVPIIEAQRSVIASDSPRIFFLLTSGEADMGNTDAIEDEIDVSILKPFTLDGLKSTVLNTLEEALTPTPFRKLLSEGKQLYQSGKFEEALARFQQAKPLNPTSPTAGHYEGAMFFKLGKLEQASGAFSETLKRHPNHYPSLLGMLDVTLKQEKLAEAYRWSRLIVNKHAIPIKRLPDLIRLSILNAQFEDILGFYKVSEAIQQSPTGEATHLSSALAVSGLHFLKAGKKEPALDAFRKAEVMGKGNPRILTRILVALTQAGLASETKSFMARAPLEVKDSTELKMAELDFLLSQPDKKDALDYAISLAQKNFPDPKVYHTAIELSIAQKRKAIATKGIISIAVRAFPDQEDQFRAYEPRLPKD